MSDLSKREEEILDFWNKELIFEKSLEKPAPRGDYVFYDGPPFASGLPHYGHLLQSAIKDAIARYRTMRGYRVRRQWGGDCHGLPVENLVEKELGIKSKRDIEQYGIEKFNEAARVSIMKDVAGWRKIIPRLGRWVDMDDDYKTMDPSYTESVWWAFKTLFNKGLIYEGFKSMYLCPRCGTTLSNFEVAQGYKDIDDIAVTVKLPLVDELNTSLLVWTTTAWTLPGNAAAAVKADALYVKVKVRDEFFIVAKARAAAVFGGTVEVVGEIVGKELAGKKYLPPFSYFTDEFAKNKNIWRVYAGDFVTMEDGTGVVHIAPAFGADDLALAQKNAVPLVRHVTDEGKFVQKVTDFASMSVKPKGNPRETDEKVAALLKERGVLFKEEKIKHSYPHCWRCDTPLLNWAATSWFVKVSALKSKLLSENAAVGWVPEHVGTGRFHNSIASAPDWAISRSRYWGAPLPVWRNTKTKETRVAGSVLDVLSMARRSGNRYFMMRHGEAAHNATNTLDPNGDPANHLTEKGRGEVIHTATELRRENIDLIVSSPFLRTRETAELVRNELGLSQAVLMIDERLHEYNEQPDMLAVRRRMGDFLFDIERRYVGKNILVVSHGNPLWVLQQVARHRSNTKVFVEKNMLRTAEVCEIPFTPYPHNRDYELDLHRPYIDDLPTGDWKRVPEVFDCWFESGSMPFASAHYPFKKDAFNPKRFFGWGSRGYPADFIAEALDQTRGWFYSLIVLGVGLFGRAPYKNVITTGLILASDGQKMSKRLKNYPDPMDIVEKYGADALRYYLLSSPAIKGEDLRFQEKGVDDVSKKLLMRLDNVRSFYDLYADGTRRSSASTHTLDRWIVGRLGEVVQAVFTGFEFYSLDAASRPMAEFIDDLSVWYVRRSRERFKNGGEDKTDALATLRYVLFTLAQVTAPVMPFFSDALYRSVKEEGDPESVHLSAWPEAGIVDGDLLRNMAVVRTLASKGLQLREHSGIKVRQPLEAFEISTQVSETLMPILLDEINVKKIIYTPGLKEDTLDTALTPELKEEGTVREWVRAIQEWRKTSKLSVSDRPGLLIQTPDAEFIRAHREVLIEATGLLSLETKQSEETVFERL